MSTSPKPESAVFSVRVTPRSSQNKIEVVGVGSLEVWVTAPPVDGDANTAVCDLLARTLGISKSRVNLVKGFSSRTKTIEVIGMSANAVKTLLETGKSA